ncbi:hypothetical protein TNIN_474801 [Trichonephila inaurata madagascariensis]|uniref:Uncharacterized protein n=1 Tax=Trichonephila inaurata madagascariensis TaxID=2747483 RepID=A0A8X6YWV9_9ARAC|nr:hypothetical protein TNIN_474801 [Trichonephila inaurata madagascariensis]
MKQRKLTKLKCRTKIFKRLNIPVTNPETNGNDMYNKDLTEFELELAISQLKTEKSPGSDLIFAEFILHVREKARNTLLKLFNKIWNAVDTVLLFCKRSKITPILKKDKPAFD